MKKIAIMLGAMLLLGTGLFAQDLGFKNFRCDAGLGISFEMPVDNSNVNMNSASFMLTLRGALHGDIRFAFNENLSIGAETGLYYITYTSGSTSTTFYDLPLHALVRATFGPFAIEPFVGYYFSFAKYMDIDFGGVEYGGKLMIGPVYASVSMVMGNPKCYRIEGGVQINDILTF